MARKNIKQDILDSLISEFGLKDFVISCLIGISTGTISMATYLLIIKNKEMK